MEEVDVGVYKHGPLNFEIKSLNYANMTIDVQFNDPGSITEFDKIGVQVNFEDFDYIFKNGTTFEQFMVPQLGDVLIIEDQSLSDGARTTI